MRLLPLAIIAFVAADCGTPAAVRPPSQQERREIVAVAKWVHAYESDAEPYRPERIGVRLRFSRLQPKVVKIRVSRSDPRFAVTVVEVRDAQGRRRPGTQVLLLKRSPGKRPAKRLVEWDPPWALIEESGTVFRLACTVATLKAIRDLSCPDPWSVLGYPRPQIRLNTTVQMRIPSSDLRAVDWKNIVLPGAACGATKPIHLSAPGNWGDAFVRSAVRAWWPAVVVSTGAVSYGDLDGDGSDEAAVNVVCSNAGGTASGQLAFSAVLFDATGDRLRSVGIITPRQPLDPDSSHVPVVDVVKIRPGTVIASEFWYGPNDGSCCASGRARTIWRYANGTLRPSRTIVERDHRRSP